MLSQVLLKQVSKEKKHSHKFFVYFDEWTGFIQAITNKPDKKIMHPHIITDDPICSKLIQGTISTKKYLVAEFLEGMKLVQKDKHVRIRKAEEQLTKITEIPLTTESDINVILYLTDYKMEVNIKSELIYKLSGKQQNSKIIVNQKRDYDNLHLFLTSKNNPMHLLANIEIDIIELLEAGYKVIDLDYLKNKIELKSIDILTKRIFKSYGIKYKNNYLNPDYGYRVTNKRRHIKVLEDTWSDPTAFSISPSTQGWILRSNFVNPSEYKIYKDIKMFLTTSNPNAMLDRIIIPYDKIGYNQEYIVKTKVDPTECMILIGEEGRNIDFKFEEIEYVKSGQY